LTGADNSNIGGVRLEPPSNIKVIIPGQYMSLTGEIGAVDVNIHKINWQRYSNDGKLPTHSIPL